MCTLCFLQAVGASNGVGGLAPAMEKGGGVVEPARHHPSPLMLSRISGYGW